MRRSGGNAATRLAPVQCIGVVCNRLPVRSYALGMQKFLVASLGNSYVAYDADTLRVKFASAAFEAPIISIVCSYDHGRAYLALANREIVCMNMHTELWRVQRSGLAKTMELDIRNQTKVVIVFLEDGSIEVLNCNNGSSLGAIKPSIGPIGGFYNSAAVAKIPKGWLFGGYGPTLCLCDIDSMKIATKFRCIETALKAKLADINDKLVSPSILEDWRIDAVASTGKESNAVIAAINSHRPDHLGKVSPLLMIVDIDRKEVLSTISLSISHHRINALSFKPLVGRELDADAEPSTDPDPAEHTLLYIACDNGDIIVFNLETMKMSSTILAAHRTEFVSGAEVQDDHCSGVCSVGTLSAGGVGGCLFFSSGADNSLKIWHIEDVESQPAVLKQRQALSGTVQHLSFYDEGDEAKALIASSNFWKASDPVDCLTSSLTAKYDMKGSSGAVGEINYYQVQQHFIYPTAKSLGVINQMRKTHLSQLPPVISLDHNFNRHYDWPNIITCHRGRHEVYLWSGDNRTLSTHVLDKMKGTVSENTESAKIVPTLTEVMTEIHELATFNDSKRRPAVCAALSSCGHFAVVGYEDGRMSLFNVQSRRCLGSYLPVDKEEVEEQHEELMKLQQHALNALQETNPLLMVKKQRLVQQRLVEKKKERVTLKIDPSCHKGPVSYINVIDATTVMSGSSAKGELALKFWDLRGRTLSRILDLKTLLGNQMQTAPWNEAAELRIQALEIQGSVAIFGLADGSGSQMLIAMVDLQRGQLMRCFGPIPGQVVTFKLSPMGNWLAVATVSTEISELRIYDILSNQLIEWMQFVAPVSSFTFHPSGAFLISAHVQPVRKLGDSSDVPFADILFPRGCLYIWANKSLFSSAPVTTGKVREAVLIDLPPAAVNMIEEDDDPADAETVDSSSWLKEIEEKCGVPRCGDSMCFSTQWGYRQLDRLLNWDSLRMESPEATNISRTKEEEMPFFLYSEHKTVSTQMVKRVTESDMSTKEEELEGWGEGWALASKDVEIVPDEPATDREKRLMEHLKEKTKYSEILDYMVNCSVPRIHMDLHSLNGHDEEMVDFLEVICEWIKSGKYTNFVAAILHLFLKMYTLSIIEARGSNDLRRTLKSVENSLKNMKLQDQMVNSLICYIKLVTLMQFE